MKRALPALLVTAAGVAWLVGFKTAPQVGDARVASRPRQPAAGDPAPAATPGATPTPGRRDGTYTGSPIATRFGEVEVKVVVAGGRIQDVQNVLLPNDRPRSALISQEAGPILRSEAIQAQSAEIDIVSGATSTSEAYVQSLGDALSRAGG